MGQVPRWVADEDDMTDHEVTMFVQALSVPPPTTPVDCPFCSGKHSLEVQCGTGRAIVQDKFWSEDADEVDPLVTTCLS